MSAVDEHYIDKVSYRLEKFKKVRDGLYNFRCPYCGDSQKHRNKARGYFFAIKQRMVYKCHNCGVGRTAPNFLKDIAPEIYAEYQIEKTSMIPSVERVDWITLKTNTFDS